MTISYNWLSSYLPDPIEPNLLSNILTSIGLEVESMEPFSSIKGGLQDLIVGEVLTCVKHPEADRLSMTTVDVGTGVALNIVCGAANVAAGLKVVVAPIGSTIHPKQGAPFTIQKAKIRGALSEGMLCAEDEIGLGESHAGILVLDPEVQVGTPLRAIFPVEDDIIFEIGLTPNRMDAMSHLGVARDVCAYLTHHHQKKYSTRSPFSDNPSAISGSGQPIVLNIEDAVLCPRYAGICISDVSVKESPDWLKRRLQAIGVKPVNNIVDATNFILHETGQPLHAFDLDCIEGGEIRVGLAKSGTRFKTLDGKELTLSGNELMISDAIKPLCIAGVYGGQNSGVNETTRRIFLECACFEKQSIRKTSMSLGLRTDAAVRFEKGIDISATRLVLERAVRLIQELGGGSVSSSLMEYYPNPVEATALTFDLGYLHRLSGKAYTAKEVRSILEALNFTWLSESGTEIRIAVPHQKTDINLPADIVEEIMRIDGLDQIEIPTTVQLHLSSIKPNFETQRKVRWTEYLVGAGYHEIFTNSISNQQYYSQETLSRAVRMMNSLTAELNILRPEMLSSGLQVIQHNLNHRNRSLRMFEFGKTYRIGDDGSYLERNHLAIYLTGDRPESGWQQPAKAMDFYDLKGTIESLFQTSGIAGIKFEAETAHPFKQGGRYILQGETIARLGMVETGEFDIKQPVFFADIDWDAISQFPQPAIQFREWSKYPTVQRDLALVVEKKVSFSQLEEIALTLRISQLAEVHLFDVYAGEKLGPEKKSMALSFSFVDAQKTLTDSDIDGYMNKIMRRYETEVNAEIRK
jgi:phenylalanyl-tRNA synthetase beta chain